MNRSFQERLSSSTSIRGALIDLVREVAPVVLFFFIASLLIFLLFKLFVSQYFIEFSAFTKAAVAALILGKVIPLLDWAESGYRFDSYRPAVVIAAKTIIYGLVVFVLGTGERIFEASRRAGTLRGGIDYVIANANLDRSLGLVLGTTARIRAPAIPVDSPSEAQASDGSGRRAGVSNRTKVQYPTRRVSAIRSEQRQLACGLYWK